ncbi:lactonohydrolase [Apiospora sp. TS-2023a]
MHCILILLFSLLATATAAGTGHSPRRPTQDSSAPLAYACGPTTANISCVNRYASFLPPTFSRDPDPSIGYTGTKVPDDPSWKLVPNADFVSFDKKRGLEVLGRAPKITRGIVSWLNVIHEAPVFVPELNVLFVAQDGPPGNKSILKLDLSHDPPTVSPIETDPPIYQPTGGLYNPKDGMVYLATLKAEWLLDNYHGFSLAGPNDLTLDPLTGDIWFTNTDYAYVIGVSDAPKQLQLATWRFRPSTGQVQIVDTSLQYPNGIQFSHDGATLYVADSGLESYSPHGGPHRVRLGRRQPGQPEAPRHHGEARHLPVLEGAPDGLKVARNGCLVIAGGLAPGVDITDKFGNQIARIQTSHPVENIQWSGDDFKTLWLVGISSITKVEFDLSGPKLK